MDCYDDRPRIMSLTNFCKKVLKENIRHEDPNDPDAIVFAPDTADRDKSYDMLNSSLNYANEELRWQGGDD